MEVGRLFVSFLTGALFFVESVFRKITTININIYIYVIKYIYNIHIHLPVAVVIHFSPFSTLARVWLGKISQVGYVILDISNFKTPIQAPER